MSVIEGCIYSELAVSLILYLPGAFTHVHEASMPHTYHHVSEASVVVAGLLPLNTLRTRR